MLERFCALEESAARLRNSSAKTQSEHVEVLVQYLMPRNESLRHPYEEWCGGKLRGASAARCGRRRSRSPLLRRQSFRWSWTRAR